MAKRKKLNYNMTELTHDLKAATGQGVDAFFSPPSPIQTTNTTKKKSSSQKRPKPIVKKESSQSQKSTARPVVHHSPIDTNNEKMLETRNDVMTSRRQDFTNDVGQDSEDDIDKKLWREIIENTETHNSSLRMSASEREQIEDIVRDLKRNYKIKTSMNEIARLGLLYLIYNFKKDGAQSLITKVKKA